MQFINKEVGLLILKVNYIIIENVKEMIQYEKLL